MAPKALPSKSPARGKKAVKKEGTKEVEDVVEKLFSLSDVDNSGAIEFGEFLAHHRSIMSSTEFAGASELGDAQLEAQFKKHDADHNHMLDKQEFKAYMESLFGIMGKRKFMDICTALVEETVERMEELKKAFNAPCSERLVEKTRAANYMLPDLQLAALQLLAQRADPNYVDPTGSHALLYAVDKADDLFIAKLLAARAHPALHNKELDCAAFRAARARSFDVLELLLLPNAKAKEDSERAERAKASQELVRRMADLTSLEVTTLLKKGADLNYSDDNGWTPLTAAVFWGKADCLQSILKTQTAHSTVKLRLNQPNARGRAALHIAARKGRAELIAPLLKARSDVDVQDTDGWTPLHHAAFNCFNDCIVALIENNANLQVQGRNGMTPYLVTKLASTGQLSDKAKKLLEPAESIGFTKLIIPVLKDETLTLFDKLEKLMEAPGVCQVPRNLRLYEQLFDSRHGPNKVRLQKLWESLAMPLMRRLKTGEADLEPPTDDLAPEAKADRLSLIAARCKDQKSFIKQWLLDTRGPRQCSDWKFDNREAYGEEMQKVLEEELAKFRSELDDVYARMKTQPGGEDLAKRPSVEVLRASHESQLQAHPILSWLQRLDPAGAFEALRQVGAMPAVRDDDDALASFVDLVTNGFDFDSGKAFWRNVYRLWLCGYAKLADADFQKRVSALVDKYNQANKDDKELEASFRGAAPKSYDRLCAKEGHFGDPSHESYEGRTVAGHVLDVIRCSITVASPSAAAKLIDEVFKPLKAKENKLELLRVENRYSEAADTEAQLGYRNIELHLLLDGGMKPSACGRTGMAIHVALIGEVQVLLQEFLVVRKQRHLIFKCSQGDYDWPDALDDGTGVPAPEEEFG